MGQPATPAPTPSQSPARRGADAAAARPRSFLLEAFDGILEITVDSATGLKAVNLPFPGQTSDPYVVVSCSDSSGKTAVKGGTTEPEWGETFRLFIRDASRDLLRIRAYDKNTLTADKELGAAMVAVATIRDGETHSLEVPLKGANGQGTIRLTARFLPFDDPAGPSAETEALIDDAIAEDGPVLVPTSASAGAAADEEGGVAALLGKLPSVKLPFLGDGDADAADVSATAADVIIDEAVGGGGVEAEGEGDTNADGVTDVGEAVEQYKQATVEAIEGAAGILEGQLAAAGADGKVLEALGSVKSAAVEQARRTADGVASFVESRGVSALPAADLTRLVLSLSKNLGAGGCLCARESLSRCTGRKRG
ncbi:hypothetical protein MNEG_14978 [Monoraphidium neglectum]|uniref:C2 domain-containing protein n=1 Tax=Monoraphidium neglectum TaxID=145388 RepID=A0A0D2MCJ3_9CHLO|nr:hypothetical protein MNEG_14978 [Monoraphidium neglectum]KIY92985.1 hypothetical protein MNEG_14978 [Monoraphidium neglectum]|eukprot:XP_013892005.1 hypothetical protein MNEG_14978 [Monoraphidium neglectum]